MKKVHKSRFNDLKYILSLRGQSPISAAGGEGISPRKARSSLRSVRRWGPVVTRIFPVLPNLTPVLRAAFSALDF